MKTILVTGGAGYIGSHVAKVLACAGYIPVVIDNLSLGHRHAVKYGPFVEGDISNRSVVRKAVDTHGITDVIHLAAKAYVDESVREPRNYFQQNVSNTLALFDVLVEAGVRRVVFSSTCATYGEPNQIPIDETHPQSPLSPYGESKLFVEKVLAWYAKAYGLEWAALRYFNAAGADPDGEIGEDHDPETHIIPNTILTALGMRASLDVYGNDYSTPCGTAVRDYTHVTDLARAHLLALQYLRAGGDCAAFNLGTGRGHSVLDVVAAVEEVSQLNVPVRRMRARAGDAPILVADPTKARNELGWTPEFTDIRDIVQTAWRWHSCSLAAAKAVTA